MTRPDGQTGRHSPKPAWIALVVIGFIVFWPVGLALLVYLKWSGRMFCWKTWPLRPLVQSRGA